MRQSKDNKGLTHIQLRHSYDGGAVAQSLTAAWNEVEPADCRLPH